MHVVACKRRETHIPPESVPIDAEAERTDIIFINFKLYADEVFIARGHKIFPVTGTRTEAHEYRRDEVIETGTS